MVDGENKREAERRSGRAALLGRYILPRWKMALGLALTIALVTTLQLVSPQIIRSFIDAVQAQATQDALLSHALLFLGVGLLVKVLTLATTYLSTDLGLRATNALREDLARHALALDLPYYRDHSPGQMIERIDGDVTALGNFFTQFTIRIVGNSLLILGILGLLTVEDWRIGAVITAYVAWSMTNMLRRGDLGVAETMAEREANAELYGFIEERLAGLDDIRSNDSGRYVLWRFDQILRNLYHVATTAWDMRLGVIRTAAAYAGLGHVLALALGALFFTQGVLSIGAVYLLIHYTAMLLEPMEHIAEQVQDLQAASASIERVNRLRAERSRLSTAQGAPLPDGPLSVSYENVSFAYDQDELVLSDVSFRLPEGSTMGMLGRSGSGKTTVTRLLFRLYDPTSGVIRLDGTDLSAVDPAHVRRRIGMVTQDVQLFSATVRDNVAFFDASIPDETIAEAIRQAGLGAWLESLPNGLDTELAPSGGDLSGGQAQLLAFARVLLADPSVVILDEPTARLDPATERRLDQAIGHLLDGRTGIIIAHRLATVEKVDYILLLEEGRVLEFGPRADLVSDGDSHFARLLCADIEECLS